MTPTRLLLLYLAAVGAPLLLAAASDRPPRGLGDELAAGAGMSAFAILLLEFVLSGRFRALCAKAGMDRLMRFHQLAARAALGLALAHPLLYGAPFQVPLPWDPSRQLTLVDDGRGLATGAAALVLLIVLVALGIGRRQAPFSYETWRLLHGLGALATAGFALHHALSAGRYSQDLPLVLLWSGLAGAAGLSLLWIYLVKPIAQRRRPWRVSGVRALAERTWELTVEPEGHAGLAFRAGQFVWLSVGRSPFSLAENPFSIASAPAEGPSLRFVIKERGDFTRRVKDLTPGTRAYLDGPVGALTVDGREAGGLALIAGGVGVAPLLSILHQHRSERDARPLHLVYGNRTEDQIVDRAALAEAAQAPQIETTFVLSEPPEGWTGRTGVLDPALIRELFGGQDHRDWLYVLCGPPAMIESVEGALRALGAPPERILAERFQYD
ncbi:MAG: ferric reductase-like transmembrane domain-containing protein [Marivibrio sp.]|uniref:ferredoxin reductase family protein n=1 Tax=Marivibrio sp. TaxID=2039719 RepID=UPI0032EE93C1